VKSPAASFLPRFADAVRFVPAGTQSRWFSDHRNLSDFSDHSLSLLLS